MVARESAFNGRQPRGRRRRCVFRSMLSKGMFRSLPLFLSGVTAVGSPTNSAAVAPTLGAPELMRPQFVASAIESAPPTSSRNQRTDSANLARAQQALGDEHVSQNRLSQAADAYRQALDLDRNTFTLDERVRMAVYISWEDWLDVATRELRLVLQANPAHVAARTHLARVYSWNGELGSAIIEADAVLSRSPMNFDALLVKADSLQWQGRSDRAIPFYRNGLDGTNAFDAGRGLSYALLSTGNHVGARESARRLSPETPLQRRQFGELSESIDNVTRPRMDLRQNFYQDSDGNRSHRYSVLQGFSVGNQGFELSLRRTDNRSRTGRSHSSAASLSFQSYLHERVALDAGVGVSQLGRDGTSNLVTGRLALNLGISNGTIGVNLANEVLIDTEELIENRVRATTYGGYIFKPWTDRFSTHLAYGYRDFSDRNHAHDVQMTPQFLVNMRPRIALGYRFRYLGFARQSQSGFFDPSNYQSHRLFTSMSLESERLYSYLDFYSGRQQFLRNGFEVGDWVMGGSASIGIRPSRALTIEFNGEGGDFAAASVAGFRYFVVGSRVWLRF